VSLLPIFLLARFPAVNGFFTEAAAKHAGTLYRARYFAVVALVDHAVSKKLHK
jgi:hypothetical protein